MRKDAVYKTFLDEFIVNFPCEIRGNTDFESISNNGHVEAGVWFEKGKASSNRGVSDYSSLEYYNQDNIDLFVSFLNKAVLKSPVRENYITILYAQNVVFLPRDSNFLDELLERLLNYHDCGQLACYLFYNGGVYIIPGDVEKVALSIIEKFEKSSEKQDDRYNNFKFNVYGDNRTIEERVSCFIDSCSLNSYNVNYPRVPISLCELPVLASKMTDFISDDSVAPVSFGKWVENNSDKDTNYSKSFNGFLYNSHLMQEISKMFSFGPTSFSPTKSGFSPTCDFSHSSFHMFWHDVSNKDRGKFFRDFVYNLGKEEIRYWVSYSEKLYNVPKELFHYNKKLAQYDSYKIYINNFFSRIKNKELDSMKTPEDIIISLPLLREKLENVLSGMENRKILSVQESNQVKGTSLEILSDSDSSIYYSNIANAFNILGIDSFEDNNLYDVLIIFAVMKNPTGFIKSVNSSGMVKCIYYAFNKFKNARKVTSLLNLLSLNNQLPHIAMKEWNIIVNMSDEIGIFEENVPTHLAIKTIINRELVENKPRFNMKNIELLLEK